MFSYLLEKKDRTYNSVNAPEFLFWSKLLQQFCRMQIMYFTMILYIVYILEGFYEER